MKTRKEIETEIRKEATHSVTRGSIIETIEDEEFLHEDDYSLGLMLVDKGGNYYATRILSYDYQNDKVKEIFHYENNALVGFLTSGAKDRFKIIKDLFIRYRDKKKQLISQINSLKADKIVGEETINHLEQQISQLRIEFQSQKTNLNDANQQLNKLKRELTEKDQKSQNLEQKLSSNRKIFDEQLEKAQKELIKKDQEKQNLEQKLSNNRKIFDEQLEKAQKELIKKDEQLEKASRTIKKLQKDLSQFQRSIILIGRTGNGKSTLANILTGTNKFKEGKYSTSQTTEKQIEEFTAENGMKYRVIDTVGIGDTKLSTESVLEGIRDVAYKNNYNLNQILFVFGGKFEDKEIEAFDLLRNNIFNEDITKYITLVRTKFDHFEDEKERETDIEKLKDSKKLERIINSCNKLIHVNNPPVDGQEKRDISRKIILNHLITCQENYQSQDSNSEYFPSSSPVSFESQDSNSDYFPLSSPVSNIIYQIQYINYHQQFEIGKKEFELGYQALEFTKADNPLSDPQRLKKLILFLGAKRKFVDTRQETINKLIEIYNKSEKSGKKFNKACAMGESIGGLAGNDLNGTTIPIMLLGKAISVVGKILKSKYFAEHAKRFEDYLTEDEKNVCFLNDKYHSIVDSFKNDSSKISSVIKDILKPKRNEFSQYSVFELGSIQKEEKLTPEKAEKVIKSLIDHLKKFETEIQQEVDQYSEEIEKVFKEENSNLLQDEVKRLIEELENKSEQTQIEVPK
ncbi:unnamed protein product [Rhizophagus irregularis]|uniref:AIG1-type G domain-containing protein n=1 Tax=Rhizophagus irregularis TaxID=588596 RepID=A0A2I1FWC9_9GLOM|nr:hypothetical protein RhiirA4_516080 [Rhizophagus irregularis]CAB4408266.1 unnamed protein product [Rhizophagus irregularis]